MARGWSTPRTCTSGLANGVPAVNNTDYQDTATSPGQTMCTSRGQAKVPTSWCPSPSNRIHGRLLPELSTSICFQGIWGHSVQVGCRHHRGILCGGRWQLGGYPSRLSPIRTRHSASVGWNAGAPCDPFGIIQSPVQLPCQSPCHSLYIWLHQAPSIKQGLCPPRTPGATFQRSIR